MSEPVCGKPAPLIVVASDLSSVGYCLGPTTRRWFAAHGLDFRAFVKSGLPVEAFDDTGDAMAIKLAAHVRATHVRDSHGG